MLCLFQSEEQYVEMDENFLPTSHQLGHVARVKPFNLQGMKTSILYDEEQEDEYVPSSRAPLRNKQLFANQSMFSNSYVEPSPRNSPFPKLDISKSAVQENPLNASLFQPMSNEESFERSTKIAKKAHLFKSGLLQKNTSSLGNNLFSMFLVIINNKLITK